MYIFITQIGFCPLVDLQHIKRLFLGRKLKGKKEITQVSECFLKINSVPQNTVFHISIIMENLGFYSLLFLCSSNFTHSYISVLNSFVIPCPSIERLQPGIAQQWIQSKREDIVNQMTEACLNQSLDALLSRDLIMKEDYELISTKPTRTSKVRQLLDTTDIQGEEFAKVIVQKLKDNKQMGLQPYPEILVVSRSQSLNLFQNKSL